MSHVLRLLCVLWAALAVAVPVRVRNAFTADDARARLAAYETYAASPDRGRDFINILEIPTGWAASMLCSGLFVVGLTEERAVEDDVDVARYVTDMYVDYDEQSVLAVLAANGGYPYKSIYREGVGCTLIPAGVDEQAVRRQDLGDQTRLPPLNSSAEWPAGEFVDASAVPPEVDVAKLRLIAAADFADPAYNTRAIVVVYKGKIVFEQYAPYLNKDSPQLGWSMTKSMLGGVVGMFVNDGKLSLDQNAPVREWADPNDARHNITIASMMHMSSGLNWNEAGVMLADCLYADGADCAGYAANEPLRDPIYSKWEYSTGTTTLLSRIVTENLAPSRFNIFEYFTRTLYDPLGMRSAVLEYAPAGYPLGGSYLFASARDWVRLGLLYQRGGQWIDGQQILPRGWAEYSCTPAPNTKEYAAQWWLKEGDLSDVCYMSGFRRQGVYKVDAKDLVVVRLAMPNMVTQMRWDEDAFLRDVLSCFP